MKISPVFILFCLCNGYLALNSHRVIAPSPGYNGGRTGNLQREEGREKIFRNDGGPRYVLRGCFHVYRFSSRITSQVICREILDREQDFRPVPISRTYQANSRRTTEKSVANDDARTTADNNFSVLLDRPNDQSISRKPSEKRINNSGKFGDGMPSNPVNGNNDDVRGNPMSTISPTAAIISEEDFSVDENPENALFKPSEKISPDSNFFAGIVNDFAFKLVDTLNLDSNFVISPLSIFVALSMVYLGADGNTKAQMERALGMDDNAIHEERFHRGIQDLLSLILKDNPSYQLLVANGMFLGQNFTVDAQFMENIKIYYNAELNNLDFGNSVLSQRIINDWVAQNTKNMITSIADSPPSLLTRLILLNAVYFQGYWKTKFNADLTKDGKFHLLNGNTKEVPFMTISKDFFPAFKSDEHKTTFIKLPYDSDQVSMIIALPYIKNQEPMPRVTDKILCQIRDAMVDSAFDNVIIPKFDLEFKTSLKEPLKKLEMGDIFEERLADLRKLSNESDIYVSDIMHKSVVKVDEVGTTASAITAFMYSKTNARIPNNFVADHPFVFYILHEASGLVLFYGKVFDF